MAERQFGEIITFYSYKGGTGRSMILANVAYLLARESLFGNRKVLMIDWDLEAPGLHRYFFGDFKRTFGRDTNNPGYLASLNKSSGLIDFLSRVALYYRDHYPSGDLPASRARSEAAQGLFQEALRVIPFDDYVLEVDEIPNLFLTKAGGEGGQRKDKRDTPTGSESELGYSEKVRRFDWENFYSHFGSFFTHFREFLMERYGYVLIDSRTGLTDTAGICTRVMPEKLVTVFVPNRQSIEGLESVIRRSWEYRQNSRDPRGLFVFPVASRLDPSDQESRDAWRRGGVKDGELIRGYQTIFQDLLREIYDLDECNLEAYFNATQVPYDKGYAYGERVAARSGVSDSLSIGHACENLTKRLVILSAPWEKLTNEQERELAEEERHRAERALDELRRANRLSSPLVFSYLGLRKIVGIIGIALPFALAFGNLLLQGPRVLGSISAYYYTPMRTVFVGALFAIGVLLMISRGYDSRDKIAGRLAGAFAIGASIFPPLAETGATSQQRLFGMLHSSCILSLFVTLAYMSLFLFTRTVPDGTPTRRKLQRNTVYRSCGYTILASILLTFTIALVPVKSAIWGPGLGSLAFLAFGVSWLTKGETLLKDE